MKTYKLTSIDGACRRSQHSVRPGSKVTYSSMTGTFLRIGTVGAGVGQHDGTHHCITPEMPSKDRAPYGSLWRCNDCSKIWIQDAQDMFSSIYSWRLTMKSELDEFAKTPIGTPTPQTIEQLDKILSTTGVEVPPDA